MSAETQAALDKAIRDDACDGHTVTDWIVLTVSVAEDCKDSERYFATTIRPGQPSHATLGLMARQLMVAQRDSLTVSRDDE